MKSRLLFGVFILFLVSASCAHGYTIDTNSSLEFLLSDLDEDGDLDYVSSTSGGRISWSENDGDGLFTYHLIDSPLLTSDCYGIDVGDIDGDGDLDIAASDKIADKITWYENDGNEVFTEHLVISDVYSNGAMGITIVDLDEDGNVDIVAMNGVHLTWLKNNGSESFTTNSLGMHVVGLMVKSGDLDGDNDIDLLITKQAATGWLENDGSESFSYHSLSGSTASDIDIVDYDGDGDPDMLISYYGSILLYINDGTGTFSYAYVLYSGSKTACTGDFDGDGLNEIVASTTDFVAMYKDSGGYLFTEEPITTSISTINIECGDIDDDGLLDFVSGNPAIWVPNWIVSDLTGTFGINGIVYDVINETPINTSIVTLTQSSTEHIDTTESDGVYNTTGFSIGIEITSNVTKTNYTHEEWDFIPLIGDTFYIDQYMIPTNVTYNGSGAIHGIVTYDPYHQALNNATITISNATWSNSTQSTEYGYYLFENLTVSDYNISASKTGYSTSNNVTVSVNGTTLQNINLEPKLVLTVVAKNADNLNLITDYSIILEGVTYDSVNGSLQIGDLEDGIKDLILTADGYYATEKIIYMDADTTTTILATQILGTGTQYAPHYVKFTVKSLFGTLYKNVDTVVYLGDEPTGTLTINGTTGTEGSVSFQLIENIQYTITFINATQNINEVRTLYPKELEYTIIVFGATLIPDTPDTNNILYGCYGQSINLTHGYINVSYNDTSATTTLAELWINDTNMTQLYYFNSSNDVDSWSQVVDGGNSTYVVIFKLTNTELSEPLTITRYIAFDDSVRVSLGLDEGWKYNLIAVIIISVIALLGSALNVEIMAVVTVLVGWLMVLFGWLQAGTSIPEQITLGMMMLFATLIAFGSVIRAGDSR